MLLRNSRLLTIGALALALVLGSPPPAQADPLPKDVRKEVQSVLKNIPKEHRGKVVKAFLTLKSQTKPIRSQLKSGTEVADALSQLQSAINQFLDTTIAASKDCLGSAQSIAESTYEENQIADAAPELGPGPKSLIGDLTAAINGNNDKIEARVRKLLAGLEKAAQKTAPFNCQFFGIPNLNPPAVQPGRSSSAAAFQNLVDLLYVQRSRVPGQDFDLIQAIIQSSANPTGGSFPASQITYTDGNVFTQTSISTSSNGLGNIFTSAPQGSPLNIAIQLVTQNDAGMIFADGFESGNTSAWTDSP